MPLPGGRVYGPYAGNIALQPGDFMIESAQDLLIATPGGGKTNALQLNTQTIRVSTVATIGDSVRLPPAVAGLELIVINHGLNAMQVFGSNLDRIDDQVTATGVSQMAFSMVIFTCVTDGDWYTEGLSSGFSPSLGLQTFSYQTIASNATNTQASGTAVATMMVNITGAAAGSVTMPTSGPGLEMTVHNISAFIVSVFPSAGGTGTEKINAGAANAALSLPASTSTVFTCNVAGQWWTVPRTPS